MQQIDSPAGTNEYRAALATARYAKTVFLWLIFLALVIQVSAVVMVRFGGVSGPADQTKGDADVKAPATKPADEDATAAETWRTVYAWVLPTAKFVLLAAGMLLVLTLLLAVKLSLMGQTGGVSGFLSAFFWSLLLWVFLIPWQQALPGSTLLAGVGHNLGDLLDATTKATAEDASLMTAVLYYLRFLAYPALVFVLWLVVQRKFARGYRQGCLDVAAVDVGGRFEDAEGKL